jgi:hypothetical protein
MQYTLSNAWQKTAGPLGEILFDETEKLAQWVDILNGFLSNKYSQSTTG